VTIHIFLVYLQSVWHSGRTEGVDRCSPWHGTCRSARRGSQSRFNEHSWRPQPVRWHQRLLLPR